MSTGTLADKSRGSPELLAWRAARWLADCCCCWKRAQSHGTPHEFSDGSLQEEELTCSLLVPAERNGRDEFFCLLLLSSKRPGPERRPDRRLCLSYHTQRVPTCVGRKKLDWCLCLSYYTQGVLVCGGSPEKKLGWCFWLSYYTQRVLVCGGSPPCSWRMMMMMVVVGLL